MDYIKAIETYVNRKVDFVSEVGLSDNSDGKGIFIAKWNISDLQQPTIAQLENIYNANRVKIEADQKTDQYKILVPERIAEKYSIADELAVQRKRETSPEGFQAYYNYVEKVKQQVKEELGL